MQVAPVKPMEFVDRGGSSPELTKDCIQPHAQEPTSTR